MDDIAFQRYHMIGVINRKSFVVVGLLMHSRLVAHLAAVPKRGADPGKQFYRAEGLGNVVVSTAVQSLCFLMFIAACRNYDHRNRGPCTQLPDNIHSIHIRKAKIQKDHIRTKRSRKMQAFCSGCGSDDLIPLVLESGGDEGTDILFVLN